MHLILLIAYLIAKLPQFMKLFYTIVLSIFFASNIFAQESKLLQNFKYRVDNYKAIGLFADAGGGVSKEYFSSNDNNLGSGIGANFNFINSTDYKKTVIAANISGGFNKANYNSSTTQKDKYRFASSSIYLNNTWYKGKNYFEIGASISSKINKATTQNYNNTGIGNSKNDGYVLSPIIGVGKGRIENVTDMQNALWLYKSLKNEKNLSGELTDEELNNLGKSITKGKNTRVLDFRRRTKFILKTVDSYLQEKGIISKTDINYFNTLNDNLFFANNAERLSGKELYLNINPQMIGENKEYFLKGNSYSLQNKSEIKDLTATIGFRKFLPQSLKHQNNYGFAIKAKILKFIETEKKIYVNNVVTNYYVEYNIQQYGPELFYEHAIYPNTRTNINVRADFNFGVQILNKFQDDFARLKLNAGINYFINYRTRFIADLGLNYQSNSLNYFERNIFLPDRLFVNTRVGIDINL